VSRNVVYDRYPTLGRPVSCVTDGTIADAVAQGISTLGERFRIQLLGDSMNQGIRRRARLFKAPTLRYGFRALLLCPKLAHREEPHHLL
jgi:hypothetical protein